MGGMAHTPTVAVIGASGFIGQHLVSKLITETDWNIHLVCGRQCTHRSASAGEDTVRAAHHRITFTHSHEGAVRLSVLPFVDTIINLASHVNVGRSLAHPAETIANNVGIAVSLLEATRLIRLRGRTAPHVIHVTTAEVFGPGTHTGLEAPARPTNPYAASKAAQDAILSQARASEGLSLTLARTANVFGEHQSPEKFAPRVLANYRDGKPITLYGKASRRWIHADDVAAGLIEAVHTRPEIVNITGERLVDNEDFAQALIDEARAHGLDKEFVITTAEAERPGHEPVYDLHPTTNHKPSLRAGIERMVSAWLAK